MESLKRLAFFAEPRRYLVSPSAALSKSDGVDVTTCSLLKWLLFCVGNLSVIGIFGDMRTKVKNKSLEVSCVAQTFI